MKLDLAQRSVLYQLTLWRLQAIEAILAQSTVHGGSDYYLRERARLEEVAGILLRSLEGQP